MKTFKLKNKDRDISGGQTVMINDAECLAQRLENAIRLDRGSWFLDVDKGIEWFTILGYKTISRRVIYSRIQNIFKNDSEVTSTNYININIDRQKRTMNIEFSINSKFGEVKDTVWITA